MIALLLLTVRANAKSLLSISSRLTADVALVELIVLQLLLVLLRSSSSLMGANLSQHKVTQSLIADDDDGDDGDGSNDQAYVATRRL